MITETSKIYSLYCIANLINGKVYIGQATDVNKRWFDHRKAVRINKPTQLIHHALIKYGLENFEFEVVASCKTQDDANTTETELVKQYNSFVGNGEGYNATLGGMNAPKTEEWKQKVSQTLMGHEVSEETRQKISVAVTGSIRSEEFKKNVGDFWRGKERTEGHRQNLSDSLKGNQNCLGKQNSLGHKHTEESKQKIGAASRGKPSAHKGKTWKIIDSKRVWLND